MVFYTVNVSGMIIIKFVIESRQFSHVSIHETMHLNTNEDIRFHL